MLAHVVRLVGDDERRAARGARVDARPGGDRLIRDGDPVAVARLAALAVGAIRLEVDPVPRGVGRPLAADVRGRGDDGHARDAPRAQHVVRDAQAEGRLAGGGRRRREEARTVVLTDRVQRRALPRAQRPRGRPGTQRRAARW